MGLGEVLAIIVATGAGFQLVRLVKDGPGNVGWKVLAAILAAAGVAAWRFFPPAGLPLALAWGVLVLLPLVLSRRIARAVVEQDFVRAHRTALVLRLLHPMDGLWHQPTVLDAFALANTGQLERAAALLGTLRGRSALATVATVNLHRLRGTWEELLEWARASYGPDLGPKEPGLATLGRALGEIGDLNGLVADYVRREPLLESPSQAHALALARLFLFAFTGDERGLARALAGTLGSIPPATRAFWIATGEIAAGHVEHGRARLAAALPHADPVTRAAIERRLAKPLAPASTLSPDARAVLERVKREWEQEDRFSGRQPLPRGALRGTTMLIVANVAAFALEHLAGGTENEKALVRLGALVPDRVLGGEWWRLASAMFLHFGPVHLAVNMLGLLALGRAVESVLRTRRFLAVYLVAGIGSMVACTFRYAAVGHGDELLVGASGAIMALVGAVAAISLRGWRRERARVAARRLVWVLAVVALQSSVDLAIPEVSFTGHFSGTIFGFLVTALLHHPGTESPGPK